MEKIDKLIDNTLHITNLLTYIYVPITFNFFCFASAIMKDNGDERIMM